MSINEKKLDNDYLIEVNYPRTSIYLANDFKNIVFSAIDNGERSIIVDFSQCDFIDSTFLGVLVVAHKRLLPVGGKIKLVITNPTVLASLEMTRINKIFTVFSSVTNAVENFISNSADK